MSEGGPSRKKVKGDKLREHSGEGDVEMGSGNPGGGKPNSFPPERGFKHPGVGRQQEKGHHGQEQEKRKEGQD